VSSIDGDGGTGLPSLIFRVKSAAARGLRANYARFRTTANVQRVMKAQKANPQYRTKVRILSIGIGLESSQKMVGIFGSLTTRCPVSDRGGKLLMLRLVSRMRR
jgi:hypothetical protein